MKQACSNFIALIPSRLNRQMLANFLELKQQRSNVRVPKELWFACRSRVLSRIADSLAVKSLLAGL